MPIAPILSSTSFNANLPNPNDSIFFKTELSGVLIKPVAVIPFRAVNLE